MPRTAELLQGDHAFIKLLILCHDHLLVVTLADDHTSVTPAEVIHTPKRVNRQKETVDRITR